MLAPPSVHQECLQPSHWQSCAARELSQVALADLLEASQLEVSRIEHRTDLYVSTLRRYVEAMGGELDIVARFPDGSVRINQFEELETA